MSVFKTISMKQKRREKNYPLIPEAVPGARIKVLATGCSHCSAMRENVKEAVKQMELPDGSLECVSSFEQIAKLGIITTPSLIIDGKLVSSGKVMSVDQIIALIKELMKDENAD